ncbi:MAG TPA: hypothetical protein VLE91_02745 [Candidatus Saccharimonadales bacterium]|nr:hypothetical protein [Candidatus Saccharimonadales bacterium]
MSYQARGRIQRLARREEKATIKRIVWLSIISLVLAVLLFTVGVSALGKFTDLLGTVFKGKDTSSAQTSLTPPTLEDLPSATNSAKLAVKGIAVDGESVDIILNGNVEGNTPVVDSKFEYDDLTLKKGSNDINAVSKRGKTTSDSSKVVNVVLKTSEPSLSIDSPTDGQNFQGGNNRVKVSGKTDKDAQVYANGFLASVDLDGNFEVSIPVSEGESTIEIKALDSAGNTKVEKRKVVYRK